MTEQFEAILKELSAKFVYLLDVEKKEGRTWDNRGLVEDIATGSAAGPAAAYLYKHQFTNENEFIITQGRFVNRPSQLKVIITTENNKISSVKVSGEVTIFAHGQIFIP